MTWFSHLGIRHKLIFIVLAVNLTIVGLIGGVHIAWDIYQNRQEMLQELSTLTALIGDRSTAALTFDSVNQARENLVSLQNMPDVIQSCLYRSDGSLLADYQRASDTKWVCPILSEVQQMQTSFSDDYLHIATEIKQGSLVSGWIYLRGDLAHINVQILNQLIFAGLGLLLSAGLTVLLAGWLQRLISKPIVEITDVASRIEAQGDHTLRAKVFGSDEVGQLANNFNTMLDALEAQNKQLRSSQKMEALGKLTGGVAHDYNNMLGVVMGYAELLQANLRDQPKLEKYVSEIQHAGKRSAKLTKKLLDFSRTGNTDAAPVNINVLLQEEQHMLEKTLTARIKLSFNLSDEMWLVWLDADELEDAVLNICINAMHAMNGNGQLTIQTSTEVINESDARALQVSSGDYVLLSIIDTGCGMDEETKDRIFDPFYSTKGDSGTGLGLSQVYGFVNSCNGAVKVYSEVGQGAKFTLYFPRIQESEVSDISSVELTSIDVGDLFGSESILVVDDEAALRELAQQILSNMGYRVLKADSAKQALKILETESIDLLLTDVIMPNMDGYELAAIVESKYPHIKIQLASGFSDDRHLKLHNKTLRGALIEKPYSSHTLLKRIREMLNN